METRQVLDQQIGTQKQQQPIESLKSDTNFLHRFHEKKQITKKPQYKEQNISQSICSFYVKGKCKFGISCKNSHQSGNMHSENKTYPNQTNSNHGSNRNDSSNQTRNKKSYQFDENLSKKCKELAELIKEEKKKGYALNEEEDEVKHESAVIGDSDNYNMILIRHAMSESNYIQSKYTKGVSKDKLKKFKQHLRYFLYQDNDSFMDASLHPIGLKQCQDISKLNSTIAYKTVFVSPLRRTMQTCIEVFKSHPNRNKINFIVYPDIAEMLKKDSDIFLSGEFSHLVTKAKNDYDITFDTESFYSSDWQFNHLKASQDLKNQKLTPQLLKRLIAQTFPQPLENFNKFQFRIKKAIQDLREIQRQSRDRTGIITHSLVAREFLNSQDIEQDEEIENLTFIYYNNK